MVNQEQSVEQIAAGAPPNLLQTDKAELRVRLHEILRQLARAHPLMREHILADCEQLL